MLAASIATLLSTVTLNASGHHWPPPYGDDEGGGEVNPGNMELKVEGEQPPDFSLLGKKEDESQTTTSQQPPTEASPSSAEPKKEPPTTERPPEGEKQAGRSLADVTAEPAKTDKTEVKPDVKPEEKKGVPEDDKDLDAHQLKPNAPPQVQSALGAVKQAAKEARAEARKAASERDSYRTELETLRNSALTKDDAEKIKAENQALKQRVLVLTKGEDPAFRAEWTAKITGAEEKLFSFLKSEGLPEEVMAKIKEVGIGDYPGWKKMGEALGISGERKLTNLIDGVLSLQEKEIEELHRLTTDHEAWQKQATEAAVAKKNEWYKGLATVVNDMGVKEAEKYPWANPMQMPANPTPEQKAAVDKHNAQFAQDEKTFQDLVLKLHDHDTDTFARTIYNAMSFEKEAAAHSETKAEVERLKAQIAQLEGRISNARKAGDMTPKPTESSPAAAPAEGDAHSAIAAYQWGKSRQ